MSAYDLFLKFLLKSNLTFKCFGDCEYRIITVEDATYSLNFFFLHNGAFDTIVHGLDCYVEEKNKEIDWESLHEEFRIEPFISNKIEKEEITMENNNGE